MRLFRATAICASVASTLVAAAGFLAADILGDSTDDSGAVQGAAFSALAGLVAILSTCLMPWIASRLLKERKFTRSAFLQQMLASLFWLSALIAFVAVVAIEVFGSNEGSSVLQVLALWPEWITLTILMFAIAALPFLLLMYAWLWIAGSPRAIPMDVGREH